MPILRKQYDFIAHPEPYDINDKIYGVGDEIIFEQYDIHSKEWKKVKGIICFEEYDVNEQYAVGSHMGVFIKYNIHNPRTEYDQGFDMYTLPDFLSMIRYPNHNEIRLFTS